VVFMYSSYAAETRVLVTKKTLERSVYNKFDFINKLNDVVVCYMLRM